VEDGNPENLTLSNGDIYLTYTDKRFGRELFVMEQEQTIPSCLSSVAQSLTSEIRIVSREISDEKEVSSYPNPFLTDFVLNVRGEEGASFQLTIKDMKGSGITENRELPYNRDHKLGAALQPGVYLLYILKQDGMDVKKIIKTN
jgi:hypothetical protein